MNPLAEHLLLQTLVLIGACVPVSAGLYGALAGGDMIFGNQATVDMDSHIRYLSGLLLAIGLGFWSSVPDIEKKTPRFQLLTAMVVTGGMARVNGVMLKGTPDGVMLAALALELAVAPVLCIWQRRVARIS